jgi:predicted transcriptional regulator of viral defense system
MALKKSMTFAAVEHTLVQGFRVKTKNVEITLLDCLVRVISINGSSELVDCKVEIRSEDALFLREYTFQPDMFGANFFKQAYLHLKTLPEFAGAVDC